MSDSDENFDLEISGSDSEGYDPAPKKGKAAPKKAATKAAPKAAPKRPAAKKTKVLVDKDDNADSDDPMDEDEPASSAGPSVRAAAPNGNTKKKTASETYTKVRSAHIWIHECLTPWMDSSRNWSTS